METCLFEPDLETLGSRGLSMADAVLGFSDEKKTTLLLANHGSERVLLQKGVVLGKLQPATIVSELEPTPEGDLDSLHVAAISGASDGGRTGEVLAALGIQLLDLPPIELDSLQALVIKFADLFLL